MQHPSDYPFNILRVPRYRQPQNAPECIHYALYIIAQYVTDHYPDPDVRDATGPVSLDLFREHIKTGRLGWETPSQEPLTNIAAEIGGVQFSLETRYGRQPQSIDELVQEPLDQLLPTIVWIDKAMLKEDQRGSNPMHAMVVTGCGDTHITVEDPLVEGRITYDIDRLNDAWDPELNTAVTVDLDDRLEPTRRGEL